MTTADLEAKILELAPKERARLAQRIDPSRAIPGADVLREARSLLS